MVVLVVDGVRFDDTFAPWPNDISGLPGPDHWPRVWGELVPQGAVLLPAYNMGTTITAPGHAQLATGRRTPLANIGVDADPYLYRTEHPTLFEEVRRQTAISPGQVSLIANTSLVQPIAWSVAPGYGEAYQAAWLLVAEDPGSPKPESDDMAVFDAIRTELEHFSPRLTFANLKEVDRTGHYGPDAAEYLTSVTDLDGPIADLWAWLQSEDGPPGYRANTVFVLTTDHGRHRGGLPEEESWRDHGDASSGDREVPLLLLGPGVRAGAQLELPYALEDLAPTLGALLDVRLPWAQGLPMAEALAAPLEPTWTRSGVAAVGADGSYVVEERYAADPAHRSAIWWGEEQLSDPAAWAAEAPVVVSDRDPEGERAWACWREVTLSTTGEDMPWLAQCARLDAGTGKVTHIVGPEAEVSPFWRPRGRLSSDGRPELNYIHNPNDIAELGLEFDVGARVARLEGGAWRLGREKTTVVFYPTDAAGVTVEGEELQLFAGCPDSASQSRNERRIYALRGQFTEDGWVDERPQSIPFDAVAPEDPSTGWRLERPAARLEAGSVEVAALSIEAETRRVLRVRTNDAGRTWGEPEVVTDDPGLYAHLSPLYTSRGLTWLRWSAGTSEVCFEDGACLGLGSPRVADVAWDGDTLHVVVDTGWGQWVRKELDLGG